MDPDNDDPHHSFNDSHRALVQAFMAQPVMSTSRLRQVLAEITTIHSGQAVNPDALTDDDIGQFLIVVGDQLSALDYEIRTGLSQPDGTSLARPEIVYTLVNAASDGFTQLATSLTADEISYVKRLLDAIFDTHNRPEREVMAVRSTEAIRLAKVSASASSQHDSTVGPLDSFVQQPSQAADPNGDGASQTPAAGRPGGPASSLTLDRAEKIIDMLVDQAWLERSRAGFLSLAPRAMVELRTWLVDTYNEAADDGDDPNNDDTTEIWQRIKMCEGCKEIVTVGQRCDQLACQCRFHHHCAAAFFGQSGTEGSSCPRCDTIWMGTTYVGERAAGRR